MENTRSIIKEARIPPVVNYCWFGKSPKPDLVCRCIASWKKNLPEYEIKEWNEENFDVGMIPYTFQAYNKKKFAFVSDYARLWILYQYGGIYLDTDVEVLKPLDSFRTHECFFGFESDSGVAPGLIVGCVPGHPIMRELMEYYEQNDFVNEEGVVNTYTTVHNCTAILLRHGLKLDAMQRQTLGDVIVYEKTVFCPDRNQRESGNYAPETVTAHHYAASWRDESYNRKLRNPIWRSFIQLSSCAGKTAARLLGESQWEAVKKGRLRRIYNGLRGIKDE